MAKYLTEPKCAADGDFESVQCNPSGKKCWCVDENGKMVGWKMGVRDKLNCSTSDEGTGKKEVLGRFHMGDANANACGVHT